ncbi:bile acid:sodium symporter family protein [Ramlibacter solisilvae]|uniref:bile acid:sodium symporter family protein n=1 Tax=Ramlibacter tataouinensis TaxID=94132 RepID=UPI000776EE4F|nr:bile acid:sodium symporter family protein [Ramlibacter tataouinensis]
MGNISVANVLLPLALAFIMFSLGLGLRLDDFSRIVRQPTAFLIGVVCHFVILPLVCYAMLGLWGLGGAFAVGFMILAACPTGSTSNLLTYIARGDVALAVSFTAVASVMTIVTLPIVVAWSLQHFMGSSRAVSVPVGMIMGQVSLMLGLPVALGMLTRHVAPGRAERLEPRATKIATLLFIVIVILAVIKNWAVLKASFGELAPFAIALNVTMLAIGFGAARLARLPQRQAVTLGIETAVQNATLALVVASTMRKLDQESPVRQPVADSIG